LKNREFGKEAAEILESGASDIVREQGASEDPKFLPQPTPPKTDSSSCFGIVRFNSFVLEYSGNSNLVFATFCATISGWRQDYD